MGGCRGEDLLLLENELTRSLHARDVPDCSDQGWAVLLSSPTSPQSYSSIAKTRGALHFSSSFKLLEYKRSVMPMTFSWPALFCSFPPYSLSPSVYTLLFVRGKISYLPAVAFSSPSPPFFPLALPRCFALVDPWTLRADAIRAAATLGLSCMQSSAR